MRQINRKSGYNLDLMKVDKESLNSLIKTVSKNKNLSFTKESDYYKIKELMNISKKDIQYLDREKDLLN